MVGADVLVMAALSVVVVGAVCAARFTAQGAGANGVARKNASATSQAYAGRLRARVRNERSFVMVRWPPLQARDGDGAVVAVEVAEAEAHVEAVDPLAVVPIEHAQQRDANAGFLVLERARDADVAALLRIVEGHVHDRERVAMQRQIDGARLAVR